MNAGGYDDGYRNCPCFWGKKPGSLLLQLEHLRPDMEGMHALDVGCGEGKNAAFLSSRGCRVDALDISPLAINNARAAFAETEGVSFSVGDARTVVFNKKYDLVVAYGLLHCLPAREAIQELILRLMEQTVPRGYHVICAFNNRHQDLSAHPGFEPTLLSHSEYVDFYSSYDILYCTDEDLVETHPHNGIEHTHSMTRLIARSR